MTWKSWGNKYVTSNKIIQKWCWFSPSWWMYIAEEARKSTSKTIQKNWTAIFWWTNQKLIAQNEFASNTNIECRHNLHLYIDIQKRTEKTMNLNWKKSLRKKDIMVLKKRCLRSFWSHLVIQNIKQLFTNFEIQGKWVRVEKKIKVW